MGGSGLQFRCSMFQSIPPVTASLGICLNNIARSSQRDVPVSRSFQERAISAKISGSDFVMLHAA